MNEYYRMSMNTEQKLECNKKYLSQILFYVADSFNSCF